MAWVSLDDRFPEHRKNDRLSDAAFRLHVAGICYCNRELTDGLIEADKVPRLAPKFRRAALTELVEGGQWVPLGPNPGRPTAYEIHDYLDWNRSRSYIEQVRAEKSAAGKKGAAAKWNDH